MFALVQRNRRGRGGESACIPIIMCPWLSSWSWLRIHMWVEFVICSLLGLRGFSPGIPVPPLGHPPPPKKKTTTSTTTTTAASTTTTTTLLNSISIRNPRATGLSVTGLLSATFGSLGPGS